MSDNSLKLPKSLIGNAISGTVMTLTTVLLGGYYAFERFQESQNSEQALLLSKGPLDLIVVLIVGFSLYTSIFMLRTTLMRRKALKGNPVREKLKLERSGSLARRFWATATEESKSKLKTFRVSPRSGAARSRFDGSVATAEIFYDEAGTTPLAISIADEVAFTDLNWRASGLIERKSTREILQRNGIIAAIVISVGFLTLMMVRNDLIWMTAMSRLDPRIRVNSPDETPVEIRAEKLLEASKALDRSDIRRTFGQITAAAELAKLKKFDQADKILDEASEAAKSSSEPLVHLAMLATARGSIQKSQGNVDKAVEYYKQGESLWQQASEKGITTINSRVMGLWTVPLIKVEGQLSESANSLARLYDDSGRLKEAEEEYRRYIDSVEKSMKDSAKEQKDPFLYYSAMLSLERFYSRHGKIDEAKSQRIDILKSLERRYSKDENELAAQLERYGGICSEYGEQGCALSLLDRAVQIRRDLAKESEKSEKKDESKTAYMHLAQALSLAADAYKRNGQIAEAEPLYSESLKIFKQDSSTDLWTWPKLELAEIDFARGKTKEAEATMEEILHTRLRAYPATDVRQARPLHLLANAHRSRGEAERAEQMYKNAITILQAKHSSKNIELLSTRADYAKMLVAMNRKKEAAELMKKNSKASESAGW